MAGAVFSLTISCSLGLHLSQNSSLLLRSPNKGVFHNGPWEGWEEGEWARGGGPLPLCRAEIWGNEFWNWIISYIIQRPPLLWPLGISRWLKNKGSFFGFDFQNNYVLFFSLGCSGGLSCSLQENGVNISMVTQIFPSLYKFPMPASNYLMMKWGHKQIRFTPTLL